MTLLQLAELLLDLGQGHRPRHTLTIGKEHGRGASDTQATPEFLILRNRRSIAIILACWNPSFDHHHLLVALGT